MKKNEELKKEQQMTDEELMNVTGGYSITINGSWGYKPGNVYVSLYAVRY